MSHLTCIKPNSFILYIVYLVHSSATHPVNQAEAYHSSQLTSPNYLIATPYLIYHINIYHIFFTPLPRLSLEPCSLIIQITITAHVVCSAVFNLLNSFFTHYCQNDVAHMKSFNGSINFRIKVKLFRMTNETFDFFGLCLLKL